MSAGQAGATPAALRTITAAIALLALAGTAAAQPDAGPEPTRPWGFGWDDGLTVRRVLGPWQVGVSAGPNDWLEDRETRTYDPALPDSISGRTTRDYESRREAGFVRLHVARELGGYRTLRCSGVLGGAYSWSNASRDELTYQDWSEEWREVHTDEHRDDWSLLLGARLAWYPVPFLSLETEFGLAWTWSDGRTERRERLLDGTPWRGTVDDSHDQAFYDYGPYSLTSDVQIIIWF